jgi:hypothetical protein
MNFSDFLGKINESRGIIIGKDDMEKIGLKINPDILNIINDDTKHKLWRGRKDENPYVWIKNSANHQRVASGGDFNASIYTAWIDTHPKWKNFPKRKGSIIMTNSFEYSNDFGTPYLVIMNPDTICGICPRNDIWGSFVDIDLMQEWFPAEVNAINKTHNINIKDWKDVVDWFCWFLDEYGTETNLLYKNPALQMYIQEFWDPKNKDTKKASMNTILTKWFDPEKNGFKIAKYSDILDRKVKDMNRSSEVWASGEAILINYELIK